MRNKDWQLSDRKHTVWQKEGKTYNPLTNFTLPVSGTPSRDFLR